jgi:hypothetical protein
MAQIQLGASLCVIVILGQSVSRKGSGALLRLLSNAANLQVLLGAFGMPQPSLSRTAVFLAIVPCAASDCRCIM